MRLTTAVPGLAFTRATRGSRWRTTLWSAHFEGQLIGTWGVHGHRWIANGTLTWYLRDWRAACIVEARQRMEGRAE